MSLSRVALPRELCDAIIDHLHANPAALRACALVCRTWVPASRYHLFEGIFLSQKCALRAARLNALLASPRGTIAPAVRALSFPDALTPIQIRDPHTGRVRAVKMLLELVPRVTQLQHVRRLVLSDLPWPLLRSLQKVERLTLTSLCVGPCLLDVSSAFTRLTHLALEGVTAIPCRRSYPRGVAPGMQLESIKISGSSIAFLGWLALAFPHSKSLSIDALVPCEVDYLLAYVAAVGPALETLELAFFGDTLG